ncbi:MAG: amidohydrolase [Chloroflexi bacterium]|nr:amidohydrolase [Chloroflexota bacterium]
MDPSLLRREAEAIGGRLTAWRRDLHQHPEIGFQERRTASIVAGELRALGLDVQTGIAETGVVAVLQGERPGCTLMLRWDMDALPIQEAAGAPYASVHPGLMHACGHDGHVAIGLGVAQVLSSHRSEVRGCVKLLFQPGEEGLGGAERMIAAGVLENPVPDAALGVHLWNVRPVGWFGIADGPVMAGAELLEIEILGQGGHGAAPQQATDPVVAAAQVVSALQTIVSRNLDPRATAVVSVTQIHAGETFNVIPDRAVLRGTIRTFEPEIRQMVMRRVTEVTAGIAAALGCTARVRLTPLTPPVVNDPAVSAKVRAAARGLFPDAVVDESERSMVSEDMAFFLQAVPGCFSLVGSADRERGQGPAHHNSQFDFDEAVLPRAVALLAAATIDLLSEA